MVIIARGTSALCNYVIIWLGLTELKALRKSIKAANRGRF